MSALEIALVAAVCMVATDVLGTVMVMAEAKERARLAGLMDMFGWYVSIATTTISVNSLSGHNFVEKVYVLIFVGAANFFGTELGVWSGRKLTKLKSLPDRAPSPRTVRSVRR